MVEFYILRQARKSGDPIESVRGKSRAKSSVQALNKIFQQALAFA